MNEFVYVGFFSLFSCLSKKKTIIEMLCFFFPLSPLVPSVTYIWLIVLAILIVKSNFKINKLSAIVILFFSALEIVAHYSYGISDFNRMGGYLLCMAIVFYLIYDDNQFANYDKCLNLYSWGTFALCALYIENAIVHSPSGWMEMMANGSLRIGGVVHSAFIGMTIDLNANSLAYFALTGTMTSLVILQNYTGFTKHYRIMFVLQMIFVTITGALTISRTWILVFIVCILLLILSKGKTRSSLLKSLLITIVVILSAVVVFTHDSGFIASAFIKRFTNADLKTGSGRIEIFEQYMALFWENDRYIWLGTGVTDYREVVNMWQSMHMGLQQILICLGIPGAIIFLISIINPTLFALKEKLSLLYWIPFVAIVLFTQTIQFLNPWLIMLPYVICVYALRYGHTKTKEMNSIKC